MMGTSLNHIKKMDAEPGRRFLKQLAVKLELVLFFLRPLTVAYYSGAGISIVAFASVTAWSVGACC